MNSPSARLLALLVLAFALAGCPCLLGRRSTPRPDAVLKAADGRLAEMAFSKFATHQGNRLYAYMNGAAEAYFAKGFLCLGTADVKWKSTDAKVEAYQVTSAKDARELFEEFDDGQGKKMPAGARSAAWDARELEGIFHRGPYFCRIIVYGNSPEAHQLLHTLAEAIDKSIPR